MFVKTNVSRKLGSRASNGPWRDESYGYVSLSLAQRSPSLKRTYFSFAAQGSELWERGDRRWRKNKGAHILFAILQAREKNLHVLAPMPLAESVSGDSAYRHVTLGRIHVVLPTTEF